MDEDNLDNVTFDRSVEIRKSTRLQRSSRVSGRSKSFKSTNDTEKSGENSNIELVKCENITITQNMVAPKEDMSRIKSAFIGNDPLLHSSTESNTNTLEKKRSRMKKLIGIKSDSSNTMTSATKMVSSVTFNIKEKLSRYKTSDSFINVKHSGILIEPGKDRTEWRVTLDKEYLRWISDRGKNYLSLNKIMSITSVISGDDDYKYGLEVSYMGDKEQIIQVFATRTEEEHALWMQKILDVTTSDPFPSSLSNQYTRAGIVNIKEGVGGVWISTWLLLRQREIFYCCQGVGNLFAADLRKVRSLGIQEVDNDLSVALDLQERVLYIQAQNEQETRRWSQSLREAALYNGNTIEQMQLNKDDLPVIVDKCIKFVAAYGATIEGIYRRAENSTSVSKLVSQFRFKDAWKLQLDPESPLDIAMALVSFIAELAEPLLTSQRTHQLVTIAKEQEKDDESKIQQYHSLFQDLPGLHYITSRRLFGHLHFIHCGGVTSARNLADSWITSLTNDMKFLLDDNFARSVEHIILFYPRIFDATEEETVRDIKMLQAIQRLSDPNSIQMEQTSRQSDLLVWISIGKYQSSEQEQVLLGVDTSASEVCARLGATSENAVLQEVVLSGALYRPLHAKENVMAAVMSWAHWDEPDRKDNQLVLTTSTFFAEVKTKSKPRMCTAGELKFADPNTKHFSVCDIELTQTSLICYKDKKSGTKYEEWNVNDIVWYVGYEPKREPLSKWSITFISKENGTNRTRDQPYFGWALGGSSKKELLYWSAGFMLAQFPGLL